MWLLFLLSLGHIACMQCIDAAYCYGCHTCSMVTWECCAKTVKNHDVVWGLMHVDPRNHVLYGGQDRTNHSPPWPGEATSQWCGLLPNYSCYYYWQQWSGSVVTRNVVLISTSRSQDGVETHQRLISVSPRQKIATFRSDGLGYLRWWHAIQYLRFRSIWWPCLKNIA